MLRALSACLLAAPAATLSADLTTLAKPVTIPIQIVKGFPVLIARIADRDMPLMFDLGGYENITLTQEAMRVAGVVHLPDEPDTWKDAKGNSLQAARFVVKELTLGDAVFHDVEGHVAAFADSFPTIPIGNVGHIGQELVRPYKVLLDYRGGTMTLIPANDGAAEKIGCRGATVPFDPEWEGEPVSRAKTDAGTLTFVWDTGASTSVIQRSIVALPGKAPPDDPFRSAAFELGGVDFGPLELRLFELAEPAGADGIVGANFFGNHVICVDYPNRRFFVR